MTVTSRLTKSTFSSTEYIFDLPNIAFGPKISRECMGWRPAGHVPREDESCFPGCCCTGQQWLFVHIMWRV